MALDTLFVILQMTGFALVGTAYIVRDFPWAKAPKHQSRIFLGLMVSGLVCFIAMLALLTWGGLAFEVAPYLRYTSLAVILGFLAIAILSITVWPARKKNKTDGSNGVR